MHHNDKTAQQDIAGTFTKHHHPFHKVTMEAEQSSKTIAQSEGLSILIN